MLMDTVPQDHKPTEGDFSPRAVTRAVRNEAIQHPLTILPAAGAIGFGFWSVLIGLGPVSLAAMLGLAFVGGVSCAYQYLIRGEDHAQRYLEERLAMRRQYEAQEIVDLEGDCRRAGFEDGVRHLTALRDAYKGFETRAHEREDATTYAHLGRDAFREGVAAIRRALEIHEARAGMDPRRPTPARERKVGESDEDRAAAREAEAGARLLAHYQDLGELAEELLARATEIAAALDTATLDLASRAGRELAQAERGSGAQLAMALEAARRVQARALHGERGDAAADAEYLQAGRGARTEKEGTHGG